MIERDAPVPTALVLHPQSHASDHVRADARLEEASGLAEALGLDVVEARIEPVRQIEAPRYFGTGKTASLGDYIAELKVQVVIVDTALTPVQQRNLEKAWNVKVIDRTGLILEIFAERARTKEGRLQVELARLSYERSRLVRTWTHLERQRGGRGFLAGPGERQIETDRRLLADKMAKLRRELEEVVRTRTLHRQRRQTAPWPTVALVGYTNAGKSSIFNTLSKAEVLAKDMPFATLDPTTRAVELPSGRKILLSDTVGFITDLPTQLIAAFRATLEEVREADVLIHVRDIVDPDHEGRKLDVEAVLDALGAGENHEQEVIEAWNKADRLDEEDREMAKLSAQGARARDGMFACLTSAHSGEGLAALLDQVEAILSRVDHTIRVCAPSYRQDAIAWLHEHGQVLEERLSEDESEIWVMVRLNPADTGRFKSRFSDLKIS
ncbi:GTPase HflX [Woodsholea maritima]|uniref:GTPase HflX n=1 Tax=Woodsholea maritima TaxID=240237 RepID=UPI00036805EC|nr:GTPase HflX [Woodsholea maritima]